MEVDGTIPDPAAPQIGYESFAKLVKEWPTEKDRDTTRARVGVNFGESARS